MDSSTLKCLRDSKLREANRKRKCVASASEDDSGCKFPKRMVATELKKEPHFLKKPTETKISSIPAATPHAQQAMIYETAIFALSGSYKYWFAYLQEQLEIVRNLPITHARYELLNDCFERALVTMHKMPRIWTLYLQFLMKQKLLTRTRRTFARALRALPVTQHDRIWKPLLNFLTQSGVPPEMSLRLHRRYLKYNPAHTEDFIDFLVSSKQWQEAAVQLSRVLSDDQFLSVKGKTKLQLWLQLCNLLTSHATHISGMDVDAIVRDGIKKHTDAVGLLWTSLADYYIRRNLYAKARDILEEGMSSVTTMRDFGVIFDAYDQFEETMYACKVEYYVSSSDEEENAADESSVGEGEDLRSDLNLSVSEFQRRLLKGSWIRDQSDLDLRLARMDDLLDRRPLLVNSVKLRQNPHNVENWHRRVELFKADTTLQVQTYAEAVKTVDPVKAVGKPHTLWVAFANLYEKHKDISNARFIFDMAVQVNFKTVDDLASVWCEWAEMELRHKNFGRALELMSRGTAEPSIEVKRRVAASGGCKLVQTNLHKSMRMWAFYLDLEESLGTLESTCAAYERLFDLKIVTPQMVINYASLLEEHKHFEDAFKAYERGIAIFRYPHVKDIWTVYLSKFVRMYGKTKLEQARDLFERAVELAPPEAAKSIYLQYAKFEEDNGLAKHAMRVYNQAANAVPDSEKLSVYEIYISRVTEIFGITKTREIYEHAIDSGLPSECTKMMCIKYAELERFLGETDRARAIYAYCSQFADPLGDEEFWTKWHEYELQYGNEETYLEMLRTKRTVSLQKPDTSNMVDSVVK